MLYRVILCDVLKQKGSTMKRWIVWGWSAIFGLLVSSSCWGQEDPHPALQADVVYGHKDGLAMTMDIYRPQVEANGATVLFIVSGGWYSRWAPPEQTKAIVQPYLDRGYSAIGIRHGSSPRYGIPDAVSDVRRAVRYLHQQADSLQLDPQRLGVLGMSAGGHLSLMLGTTGDNGNPLATDPVERHPSRVAAVVAYVPPTDLRVAVWEAPESLPAYRQFPALNLPLKDAATYSPLTHVSSDDAPALVVMGGADELVPAKHGEWIAEAFQREGVPHKLIVVPDAGHGLEGEETQAMVARETIGWFNRHLSVEAE